MTALTHGGERAGVVEERPRPLGGAPGTGRRPQRGPGAAVRWLRRMSTALLLLLALAAAAVLAVAIPQETTNAATVAHWRAGTAGPGPMATALLHAGGLFDVIGSWWFRAIAGLLVISLVACLVPRHRALLRRWRRPPPAGRDLDVLTCSTVIATRLPGEAALGAVRTALRRRGYRLELRRVAGTCDRVQLAAERGVRARELGSVLFHDAVLLLLVGVAIGRVFGFVGQVDLVEGTRFVETRLAYDRVATGPGFGLEDHRAFTVGLERFRTSDHPDGTPREFVATLTVDGGAPVDIAVNHPLVRDGVRIHLARHGLAPTVRITDTTDGTEVFHGPVLLAQAGPLAWAGLATVREGSEERVVDIVLLPDAVVTPDGTPRVVGGAAGEALLVADVYPAHALSDDGQRRVVDRRVGAIGGTAVAPAGIPAPLGPGSWEISFDAPVRWAGLQVSQTPGFTVLLVAGMVLLVGLALSLHITPQRLWVEARPMGSGTELVVAAVARRRPWALERSFPSAVASIERRLATRGPADADR